MKRIINHRDFNVFCLDKSFWDVEYHNHNFYEIIVIEDGCGQHRLNDLLFNYNKGDVFFLTPNDAHEFIIKDKTKFIYIKFTEQFIYKGTIWSKDLKLQALIENLKSHKNLLLESFITDKTDQKHFLLLAKMVHYEFKNNRSLDLIFQLFISAVLLLTTNYRGKNTLIKSDENKVEQILSYINYNFLDAEKMKISTIAKEFNISEKYISIFVKKKTGLSIQNHVFQFKLKTAEKLLKQSNYNINEISTKLGFTDSSHFNKFFKKYKLVNPSNYK